MTAVTLYSPSTTQFLSTQAYQGFFGRLTGWLLYCMGWAYRIVDDHQTHYVSASSLLQSLIPCSSDQRLQRCFLEALQPVIGAPITAEQVSELASWLQGVLSQEEAELALEQFKVRRLQVLSYDESELTSRLKPGDLIFKKLPDDQFHIVTFGQKWFQPFIRGFKEREAYKFSHAAIYLGEGLIAEAAPDRHGCEVRILPLGDPRFSHPGERLKFWVSRLHDEGLANEVVAVAKKVAMLVPEQCAGKKETLFKYTGLQAFLSIWNPDHFGTFARHRYLKQYIDDRHNELPRDFMGLKSFFCSNFVGYCLQTAESRFVMPRILGAEDVPAKMRTLLGDALSRALWTRFRRIQAWRKMSEEVSMQFDSKRLTPQGLRNFVIRHPELMKDKYIICGI